MGFFTPLRYIKSSEFSHSDIEFTNRKSDELVARIEDYECTLDKSLNEAFRRHGLG